MKKIIYSIQMVSRFLFNYLILSMIPFIFESNWQGIFFFLSYFILLIVELFFLFTKNYFDRYIFIHQLFVIFIMMYFSVFYYKIYSIGKNNIDLSYLQMNYFYMAILLVIASCMLIFYKKFQKKKV